MPFTDYAGTPFVPHLLPVIPKGAPIASKIEPEKAGKIPGLREPGGWTGFKGWPSMTTPEGVLPKWDSWYPNGRPIIGLRGAELPGVDMDADHPTAAEIVEEQARRHLGPAPKRGRANSRKYLLMYRLKAGEPPITKKRIDFEDPFGDRYAIELLGRGQHYVIEGEHPLGRSIRMGRAPAARRLRPADRDHEQGCRAVLHRGEGGAGHRRFHADQGRRGWRRQQHERRPLSDRGSSRPVP
jgi:hypothetical protein